jgi:hypothetical protein
VLFVLLEELEASLQQALELGVSDAPGGGLSE